MKGIVLEIRDGVAAVLREDGVVVKSLQHCSVGDTVEVPGDHVIRLRTYRRAAIAAAAAVLLLTGTVYGYNNIIPVSQVTVETGGAELSYTLNRKGRVLRMEAVNEEAREIVERLNAGRNGSIIEKRITLTEALEQTIAQTMPLDQNVASDQVTAPEFRITDVRSDSETRRKALLEEAEEAVLRNTPTAPDTSVPAPEGQHEPNEQLGPDRPQAPDTQHGPNAPLGPDAHPEVSMQPGPAEESGSFTQEQPPHAEQSFEARPEEAHTDTDRPDSTHTDGSQPEELLHESRPEDAKPDLQTAGGMPEFKDTPEAGAASESGATPEAREISESGETPEAVQNHEPGLGQQEFAPEQPADGGKIHENDSINNADTSGYVDDPGRGGDPGHGDSGHDGDSGHGGDSGHDGDSGHGGDSGGRP